MIETYKHIVLLRYGRKEGKKFMKKGRNKAFKRCIAISLAIVMVATTYLYSAEGSLRAVETGDEQAMTPTEKQQTEIVLPAKEEQTAEEEPEKSLSAETKQESEKTAEADVEKDDSDEQVSQKTEETEKADNPTEGPASDHNASLKDDQSNTRTAKFFAQISGGGADPRG